MHIMEYIFRYMCVHLFVNSFTCPHTSLCFIYFTGDFSKEDVAAALLHLSIQDTVQCISNVTDENIKHMFICGSYATRDFVREMFTYEWEKRKFNMLMMAGKVLLCMYHICG